MTLHYRPAEPADATALADLGKRAFCAAFAHLYTPQDLAAFLAVEHTPAKVATEIADPGMLVHLAADEDGTLLGFCKLVLTSSLAEHGTAQEAAKAPLELKQLYLDPARIGGGIGAALMDWTLEVARARGADEIQLSVWSGNIGAQRFYARYGFAKIADITFCVGEQVDEEFLFARPMVPGA